MLWKSVSGFTLGLGGSVFELPAPGLLNRGLVGGVLDVRRLGTGGTWSCIDNDDDAA